MEGVERRSGGTLGDTRHSSPLLPLCICIYLLSKGNVLVAFTGVSASPYGSLLNNFTLVVLPPQTRSKGLKEQCKAQLLQCWILLHELSFPILAPGAPYFFQLLS